MSHPFRFYGARPGDWFEGANCGHMWEVQFAEVPDAAARLRIGEAFGRAVGASRSIDCACQSWGWLGAFALVTLGEQLGGQSDLFWHDVQRVWTAVHEAVPIVEVHFGGTREAWRDDDWSRWSVAQKAVPGPAPDWGEDDLNLDIYGGKIARDSLGQASEDLAFEAAKDDALAAALTAADEALLAPARAARRVLLLPTTEARPPRQTSPSAQVMQLAHTTAWSRPGPGNRAFALLQVGSEYRPAIVDASGIHELLPQTAPSWSFEFSADGEGLFLAAQGVGAFHVPLTGLRPEALARPTGKVSDGARVGTSCVLLEKPGDTTELSAHTRDGAGWREVARVRCPALKQLLVAEAAGVVALELDPPLELRTLFLVVRDGQLGLLGGSRRSFERLWQVGAEVYLRPVKGGGDVQIANLADAAAAALQRPVADLGQAATEPGLAVDLAD